MYSILSFFRTMWTKGRYAYHVRKFRLVRMALRRDTDICD